MTTARQWRLMINGEVVDAQPSPHPSPTGRGGQSAAGASSTGRGGLSAAGVSFAGREGERERTGTGWPAWWVLVVGAVFEVGLSVYGLARFGFGWHVLLLGSFAMLLLVIASREWR